MRGSWTGNLVPAPAESFREPFRSLEAPARPLLLLIGVGILFDMLAVGSGLGYLSFFERLAAGEPVTMQEAEQLDARQGAIGLTQLALLVVTAVVWLIWFRRAYRNLSPLGVESLRFKPGWAVGSWFVPILNTVRPKEITNDIWRASDPDLPAEQGGPGLGRPVWRLIDLWWAAGLIGGVMERMAFNRREPRSPSEYLSFARWLVAGDAAAVVWAVLAYFVVRAITRRQTARHEKLTQGRALASAVEGPSPSSPPPPPLADGR